MPRRATWLSSFGPEHPHERNRQSTFTLASGSRKKERRWPLVLRFWKGSIHVDIIMPIICLSLFASAVVYAEQHISTSFNLPSSIIPSLSIVVGLELVFRNQTSYQRFWTGRLHLNTYTTSIRNISRSILVLVPAPAVSKYLASMQSSASGYDTPIIGSRTPNGNEGGSGSMYNGISGTVEDVPLDKEMEYKTMEVVKILIAMLYSVKNHLRADWGIAVSAGTILSPDGQETADEYKDLLPPGMKGYEHRGLGLTLQLTTFVEHYIRLGTEREWFATSAASSMIMELNKLVSAYGDMEVIRLAPTPVAHLIHSKQVLAAYCCILPFAMAAEIGWWTVPLVAFVSFTFYGIEGIAQWHEDPFGRDKIDINMDAVVEDARREVEVLLSMWQSQGQTKGGPFQPHLSHPRSTAASMLVESPTSARAPPGSRDGPAGGGNSAAEKRRQSVDTTGGTVNGDADRYTSGESTMVDIDEERGDIAPLLRGAKSGGGNAYGGA